MARQIIVNATPEETRVATMEDARLLQVEIERARERGLAGSIYKGRVTRVLPGMQAAFVDVGLAKSAFLPAADFFALDSRAAIDAVDRDGSDIDVARPVIAAADEVPRPPIEERLKSGQEVIVQIAKEPIGSKGPRVTSNVSLPGRLLVYLPTGDHIGVSKRIEDEAERLRLQEAVESVGSPRGGVIVRTACAGVPKREIQADLRLLRNLWRQIATKAAAASPPALLHQDLDVVLRTVRDIRVMDVGRIVVDDRAAYARIVEFIDSVMPRWRPLVELYDFDEPIFDRYGVEGQINKALDSRVWLRSGGYIVIDQTEALISIDVNTGRFVGRSDQRDTALKTNLEAAHVIAEQLRLRNLGGVIVIDFIDLQHEADRQAVLAALGEALNDQRARAEVHGFSELGLVEITRHRRSESLAQRLCEPCPTCDGRGYVKGTATIAYEILRRIRRAALATRDVRRLDVRLHGAVASFLAENEPLAIPDLARELGIIIVLQPSAEASTETYSISAVAAVPDAL